MPKFRNVMRWIFGLIAADCSFLITYHVLSGQLSFSQARITILVIGILCGIAWWTLKTGKTSARRWTIAAGVALLLDGTLLLGWTIRFSSQSQPHNLEMVATGGFYLVSGIAGLIAFWPKDSVEQMSKSPAAPRNAFQTQPKLKRFVCWCFSVNALLFAACIPFLNPTSYKPDPGDGGLRYLVGRLLFAFPLAVAIPSAMAWWTVRKRKASGRRWAIVASTVMLLLCTGIGIGEYKQARRFGFRTIQPTGLIVPVILLVSGIAGLVAFVPRNAMKELPLQLDIAG